MTRFDAAMYAAILGIIMPPVVAFMEKPDWPKLKRMLPPALLSLLVGFGTAYFSGQLNTGDIISSIAVTFMAAVSAYHLFWKEKVQSLERKPTIDGEWSERKP